MKAQTVLIQELIPLSKGMQNDIPNRKPYLGISYPKLKLISKSILKVDWVEFLETNDLSIYELEILQTYIIGSIKNLDQAIFYFDQMIHQVKEWSVVDSLCQKFVITKKYPNEIMRLLEKYSRINDEYIQRVVSVMLLSHFNNDMHIEKSITLIKSLTHPGYFNKMGISWALATFMIHYPDKVIPFIKSNDCDNWIRNKTIQKSLESYRIKEELKLELRELRNYVSI